jgi:hypothetical protein
MTVSDRLPDFVQRPKTLKRSAKTSVSVPAPLLERWREVERRSGHTVNASAVFCSALEAALTILEADADATLSWRPGARGVL